jgi:hypothetical protein
MIFPPFDVVFSDRPESDPFLHKQKWLSWFPVKAGRPGREPDGVGSGRPFPRALAPALQPRDLFYYLLLSQEAAASRDRVGGSFPALG